MNHIWMNRMGASLRLLISECHILVRRRVLHPPFF